MATALGNLSADELQRERREPLEWKVIRVDEIGGGHHYSLLVRHPKHRIDVGIHSHLKLILERLSILSERELQSRFDQAKDRGLRPVPLIETTEQVDYWLDKDWTLWWVGEAVGIER